jgi:uncharacterized membrane protein YfcA
VAVGALNFLEVAAGAAVIAGAGLQSATGFGFNLIASPLLFAALEPEQALGLSVALNVEVNLLTLVSERRRPEPLTGDAAALLAWSIPGLPAGVYVLRTLDTVALQVLVSAGVVATLLARWAGTRREAGSGRRWWTTALAGLATGSLASSTNTTGPPLVLYLTGRGIHPQRVRDTLTVCFIGVGPLTAVTLWATGTSGAVPEAAAVAALVPAVAVGHLAGRPIFARLADGRYEAAVTAVLLASVVIGLIAALT